MSKKKQPRTLENFFSSIKKRVNRVLRIEIIIVLLFLAFSAL